jgi:O-antigen/teichoic acid export membrane protein
MFAAQAASAIVYQGDRILVAALGSTAMAGLYALCNNIANKTGAAVVAINSFVMPHAAGLQATGNRDATTGLVHALDRAVAALLVPLLAPALLLAEPFFRLWLGAFATPELVIAFRILFVAFVIPAFAMPVSNVLIAGGGASLSARFAWLTVGVVLISMVTFVPRFGLIGAAAAMLLGNATSLLFAVSARRALDLPVAPGRRHFWYGLALGCVIQTALTVTLSPLVSDWTSFLLVGGFAWVSFYAMRAIVSALSPEEKELLRRLVNAFRGA